VRLPLVTENAMRSLGVQTGEYPRQNLAYGTENKKINGMVTTLRQGRSTSKQLSLSKNLQVEKKTAQVAINPN